MSDDRKTSARIYYVAADGYLRDVVAEIPEEATLEDLQAAMPVDAKFRYAVPGMTGYWIALAAAGGTLIGYLVAIAVVGVSHADVEDRLADELAAAQRQLAIARRNVPIYDWAGEADVQADALEFSGRMVTELASEVGMLRAMCYEMVAWLENPTIPPDKELLSAGNSLAHRIRAVLEDVEALEEGALMQRIEYRDLERSRELPPGPWDDEPDKVQWPDETSGLACMIRRGPLGQWCGYVGVPPGSPLYGRGYSDPGVPDDVHGGLSYAAACDGDEVDGICHVPGPGEPEPLWWFGFDCGHAFDLTPGMPMLDSELGRKIRDDQTYRDVEYVTAETVRLAAQIGELA